MRGAVCAAGTAVSARRRRRRRPPSGGPSFDRFPLVFSSVLSPQSSVLAPTPPQNARPPTGSRSTLVTTHHATSRLCSLFPALVSMLGPRSHFRSLVHVPPLPLCSLLAVMSAARLIGAFRRAHKFTLARPPSNGIDR